MICVGCPKIREREYRRKDGQGKCYGCSWDWEKQRNVTVKERKRKKEFEEEKRLRRENHKPVAIVTTLTTSRIKAKYYADNLTPPEPQPHKSIVIEDRRTERYNEWRDAIRVRDRRTCVLCRAPYQIVVHHIERWIDSPKKRYDLKNGVCLCRYCHDKHHGPQQQAFPEQVTSQLRRYIQSIYEVP